MSIKYEVTVSENGDVRWRLNGKLHREDGPAVECASGQKEWWNNGKRHRQDGPAIVYASGTKSWFLNGKLHREDGPAIEYADGTKSWYLNGIYHTEKAFNAKMNPPCEGKTVTIDGVEYILKSKS